MKEAISESGTGWHRAYLGLGSNMGDRWEQLRRAVQRLSEEGTPWAHRLRLVAVSPVYETAPVGGPTDQTDYLNAVAAVDTDLGPRELLNVCRHLEAAAGRARTVRWGPRTLDVDVLLVGGLANEEEDLRVPHPRMVQRGFVMVPLADLDPELARTLLTEAGCPGDVEVIAGGVRRAGSL